MTKLLPATVRVNPAPPAVALVGERLLIVGMGLLTGKTSGAEAPPVTGSGSKTETERVPAVAISEATIAVDNCVESTNVVVRSTPLMRITKVLRKFAPMTVSVKPGPPAVALEGERLVTFGAATIILKALAALGVEK